MAEQKATNIVWHQGAVTRADRERLSGHRSATVWFTGLSGSGKSTIAVALEKALWERGVHAFEGVHAAFPERLLERHRDGGLARAGEPGEPDRGAAVPAQALPIGPRDGALVPDDVGRLLLGHRACPLSVTKRTVQTMR